MAKIETYKGLRVTIFQTDGYEIDEDSEYEVVIEPARRKRYKGTKFTVYGGLETEALEEAKLLIDQFFRSEKL